MEGVPAEQDFVDFLLGVVPVGFYFFRQIEQGDDLHFSFGRELLQLPVRIQKGSEQGCIVRHCNNLLAKARAPSVASWVWKEARSSSSRTE